MSRPIRFTVLIGCGLVIVVIAVIALRNYRFEAGARALETGDYPTALSKLRPLASLGDSPSQYVLGEMYAFGFGLQKDEAKAIYWFRRAAVLAEEGADPAAPAELSVSTSFAEGRGVKADAGESLKWLQRAAAGGSREALLRLRTMHSH